ncbi:hypothetical protein PCC7424_5577 (plasmid) [Gloeothece citriformis PCC 7424]|uniref:TIR domain-containing protein n=1 Tax=Gloeothece citriformis (strain PCC 7424) TaxID=65393 RepID=B7KMW9_GLOC7|nr:toll/interleukin-1 receptor domain-containing protein [Gloeothece citriformis]ACK74141.1 hypothetical protein PCC7424_5577 [Gloeothece citriformis PCC 7424]
MIDSYEFDVFLAYNSVDKPLVKAIAKYLKSKGLRLWFDEEQIKPGDPIADRVIEGIFQSPVALLFIGTSGFGKFQRLWELNTLIMLCCQENIRIIPILLPGVDLNSRQLGLFYGIECLQFHQSVDETEKLEKLVQAIRGDQRLTSNVCIIDEGLGSFVVNIMGRLIEGGDIRSQNTPIGEPTKEAIKELENITGMTICNANLVRYATFNFKLKDGTEVKTWTRPLLGGDHIFLSAPDGRVIFCGFVWLKSYNLKQAIENIKTNCT